MDGIEKIFGKYHIAAVYLFGSRAREEHKDRSDYDFGVLLEEARSSDELADLKFILVRETARFLRKPSDIVVLNSPSVPLSLKFRIIKEGRIIYESDSLYRSRFEARIISFYLDRKYYYQRHIAEVIENTAKGGLIDRP